MPFQLHRLHALFADTRKIEKNNPYLNLYVINIDFLKIHTSYFNRHKTTQLVLSEGLWGEGRRVVCLKVRANCSMCIVL